MNPFRINVPESRRLIALAVPITGAALVNMGMSITDTVMMGWISADALAAGAVISDLQSIVFYFMAGVLAAVAPMIAQAMGAGDRRQVRRCIRQGSLSALFMAAPAALAVAATPELLHLLDVDPAIVELSRDYAWTLALTIVPMMFVTVWRHAFTALGRPRVYLTAIMMALPANAALNAVLMFGHGPVPALGLTGAGLSSAAVSAGLLAFFIVYAHLDPELRRYRLFRRWWIVDWARQKEIFRLGLPIGVTSLGEVGLFLMSTAIISLFGAAALAAHAITLRLAGLVYAVVVGISQATTVRVGYAVGCADSASVRHAVTAGIGIGTLAGLVIFLVLITGAHALPWLFLEAAAPRTDAVAAQAATLIVLLGVLNAIQGPAAPIAAVLRGLKDTRTPMVCYLTGYWAVGLPTALLAAFPLDYGAAGVWSGLVLGLAATALMLFMHVQRQRPQAHALDAAAVSIGGIG